MNPLKTISVFIFLAFCSLGKAKPTSNARFIKNAGQWNGAFHTRLTVAGGAVFFEESGYTVHYAEATHHPLHDDDHLNGFASVAWRMRWVNPQKAQTLAYESPDAHRINYINQNGTFSNLKSSHKFTAKNVFPGIDYTWFGNEDDLEYDIRVAPNANPNLIKYYFEGLQDISIAEGSLHLKTAMGTIAEYIPEAYQMINGRKINIRCTYTLNADTVSFNLGAYNTSYPLIIDPVLEFSTFSGSLADNYGATATYDNNGNAYGGGIAFSTGYPVTTGAFQEDFNPNNSVHTVDVAISKFSADGSQLIYATYIGGSRYDVPHSLVVNKLGQLVILGSTGSDDFPLGTNGYQSTFAGGFLENTLITQYGWGSDAFIFILSEDGTQRVNGTYLGGSSNDGINFEHVRNYGDNYRGEVITDNNNNIYLITSAKSYNITSPANSLFDSDSTLDQRALICKYNPNVSTMLWGTFVDGSNEEAGYGLTIFNNELYATGATNSEDLLHASTGLDTTNNGGTDGFLSHLNANTGQIITTSYFGTSALDQCFLIQTDRSGDVYVTGQTKGNIQASNNVYSNASSQQFIAKLNPALSALEWQTPLGSGGSKSDLVPTAFLVDNCYNIYLAGWNGESNKLTTQGSAQGNTTSLPVTSNALQSTTDGSDFYTMVLNRDAQNLVYASYFGGNDHEHVDGGTSRFDPNGIVYQAVCADCSGRGFPTTPGVYAEIAGGTRCNLAVYKIDFQQVVSADIEIDFDADVDTICDALQVTFSNNSINSNKWQWDFGNGYSSSLEEPSTIYENFGTYTITLIATDTLCDISDTATIQLTHNTPSTLQSGFLTEHIACDAQFECKFENQSINGNEYYWDFGDGSTSTLSSPVHQYAAEGTYQIRLIARDTNCNLADTTFGEVVFADTLVKPKARLFSSECSNGTVEASLANDQSYYQYFWKATPESPEIAGREPELVFTTPGVYEVTMRVEDSRCRKTYIDTIPIAISSIAGEVFIPNSFTPNKDGSNEKFALFGDPCTDNSQFLIFNRWGEVVFQSNQPFSYFWDGNFSNGQPAPQGVYTYMLQQGASKKKGLITLIR